MKVNRMLVSACATNCYIVVNEDNNQCFIVDPGDQASRIVSFVKDNGLDAKAILLTHGHFDHAGAAAQVSAELGVQVYAYHLEQQVLEDPEYNLSGWTQRTEKYSADVYLKDRQEVDIAGFHIICLFTPGHTPGGCCYYIPREDTVFSGDSLFCESVGRTDFPGGSMSQLVGGVKEKLMTLPERTLVLSGHGEPTTIENERMYNPYL